MYGLTLVAILPFVLQATALNVGRNNNGAAPVSTVAATPVAVSSVFATPVIVSAVPAGWASASTFACQGSTFTVTVDGTVTQGVSTVFATPSSLAIGSGASIGIVSSLAPSGVASSFVPSGVGAGVGGTIAIPQGTIARRLNGNVPISSSAAPVTLTVTPSSTRAQASQVTSLVPGGTYSGELPTCAFPTVIVSAIGGTGTGSGVVSPGPTTGSSLEQTGKLTSGGSIVTTAQFRIILAVAAAVNALF